MWAILMLKSPAMSVVKASNYMQIPTLSPRQAKRARLIILRGVPGAGKSTLARRYLQLLPDAVHLEADQYFVDAQGHYQFDGSKLSQAHLWCQQQMRQALSKHVDVIVSNTSIRRWELQALLAIGRELKATVDVIRCCGEFTNSHGVPVETVAAMALNYQIWPGEQDYYPDVIS